jgi:polar amino acid transport system ATP-binding protein
VAFVKIEGLTKSFGDVQILKGIDIEVERGEVVSIIGPSGSGKTTILRCLNVLERADGGHVEVDGRVVCSDRDKSKIAFASKKELRSIREGLGMVFQRFNLFPHMTALENIIEAPIAVKGSHTGPITIRLRCRVGNSSESRSLGRWPWSHPSCCSTKSRRPSTQNSRARSSWS